MEAISLAYLVTKSYSYEIEAELGHTTWLGDRLETPGAAGIDLDIDAALKQLGGAESRTSTGGF